MRRRDFIGVVVGLVAWPIAARAQKRGEIRRIGVLMDRAADDPQGQARLLAFRHALQQLGWSDGYNMRIETRWGEDDVERERKYAAELVALAPDVILASGTLSVAALQRVTPPCRSCSRPSPIRSATASLIPCRGRAATPPALCCLNTV